MYASKKIFFISILVLLATAFVTQAAALSYETMLNVNCTAAAGPPAPGGNTIPECIRALVEYIITLALPVAAIFIIISGFLFVTASGDPKKLETAKATLTWTIIGLAIAVAAWTLSIAFTTFFSEL
ncbi:MAG: hypothetical protein AAB783_00935 [Patescibacteria group bacterium]